MINVQAAGRMLEGVCNQCDCREGEQGAVGVRERRILGTVMWLCEECALFTDADALEALDAEGAFFR